MSGGDYRIGSASDPGLAFAQKASSMREQGPARSGAWLWSGDGISRARSKLVVAISQHDASNAVRLRALSR